MAAAAMQKQAAAETAPEDENRVVSILARSPLVRETLSAEANALAAERQALLDEMAQIEKTGAATRADYDKNIAGGPRENSRGRGSDANRGAGGSVYPGSVRPGEAFSRRSARPN